MNLRWRRRAVSLLVAVVVVVAAVVVVVVAGGGSSGSGGGSDSAGATSNKTLTIGVSGDVSGLSPLGTCGPSIYCLGTYDSLVYHTSDGRFLPDLAVSWKFDSASHKRLRLQLRKGAYFEDGSELTGSAVAGSITKFMNTAGAYTANAFPITKVVAVSRYVVDIYYSSATTLRHALLQISENAVVGSIVAPAGVENPSSLLTATNGIGPYKYDPSQSTKGSTYTFVPNSKYFNQKAIRYSKVVYKVMTDPNSRLNAAKTGQIDYAYNMSLAQGASARQSELQTSSGTASGTRVLVLANRAEGPLANAKVREALQYAVPRDTITKAVFGDQATATASIVSPGTEGYNAENVDLYPYNPDKAKRLLSAAGYPNGFTISMLDDSFSDPGSALGQALASALKDVGVTLKLTTTSVPPGEVTAELATKKYDTFIFNPVGGLYTLAYYNFASEGGAQNPFGMPEDETLMSLINTAALAEKSSDQEALMRNATTRLDKLNWGIAISNVPNVQVVGKDIRNVPETYVSTNLTPFAPLEKYAWYTP